MTVSETIGVLLEHKINFVCCNKLMIRCRDVSQGEFTLEDSTDYLVQGPLCSIGLAVAARACCYRISTKFETQRRWMLGIILLSAIAPWRGRLPIGWAGLLSLLTTRWML